jgi:hypothetical protein
MMRLGLGMTVALAAVGCFRGEATLGAVCEQDADCGADQVCVDEVCGYCGDGVAQAGELCTVEALALTAAPRATPADLLAIDLERDGKIDLVTRGEDGTVELWDGDGGGGWTVRTRMPAGGVTGPVRLAELDEDETIDLVVVDAGAPTIELGYGDGSGAFTFTGAVAVGDAPVDVAVGAADWGGPAWVVWVDGQGLWQALVAPQSRTLGQAVALAGARAQWVADPVALDEDDALDLVVADVDGMVLEPWFGDGAGGLSRGEPIALEGRATEVVTLDLDGDGDADVLVPDEGGGVTVIVSDAEGGLEPAGRAMVPGVARGVTAADLDRDSDRDLVVVTEHDSPVWVLRSLAGRYRDPIALPAAGAVGAVLGVDGDRDGLTELLLGPSDGVGALRVLEVEP